jgi:DNA processing protein
VLAVPGHPVDARAAGCNMLIRDGATLVRGPEDVIEMLGKADRTQVGPRPEATPQPGALREGPAPRPARPNPPERAAPQTAALHRQILDRLGPSPLAEDQLIRDLALPAAEIAPQLLELELEGRIQRQAGGLLARLH